jgi:hypothetical protein
VAHRDDGPGADGTVTVKDLTGLTITGSKEHDGGEGVDCQLQSAHQRVGTITVA